jgi:DNA-binding PadR family transcriptional regulator
MTKNDLVVLGLLKEQPMHGYQIKHQIELRELDHWAHVSLASIYYTLNRLEEKGCIIAHHEKVGRMPERTVYQLTEKGERQLSRLVEKALISDQIPENDFAVGVAFMYGLKKEKVEACLEEKMGILQKHADHLQRDLLKDEEKIPFNWLYLARNGLAHLRMEIEHLKGLRRDLKRGKNWNELINPQQRKGERL